MLKNFGEKPGEYSPTDSEIRAPIVTDDSRKDLSIGQIERASVEDLGERRDPVVPDDAHFHLSVGQIIRGRARAELERYN